MEAWSVSLIIQTAALSSPYRLEARLPIQRRSRRSPDDYEVLWKPEWGFEQSGVAKKPFDLKQPIVFRNPFATASGSGFDLTAAHGNSEVGHERVFGFT